MPEKPAIQAFQVSANGLQRVIRLTGAVEATVEFRKTLAADTLRVNGKTWPGGMSIRGLLGLERQFFHDFVLASPRGPVRARLVAYAPGGEVWKVSLQVAGAVVYADEDYGQVVTVGTVLPNLPVPASDAEPQPRDLPVPAADPGEEDAA